MKRFFIFFLPGLLFACSNKEPVPDPPLPGAVTTYGHKSLVAVDPDGKEIAFGYDAPRDRKVGIFYFIWQGAHGYDKSDYYGGDILPPTATDTRSPFDISEMEVGHSDPQTIPFGDKSVMHHWGKPYLGYYVGNDAWVIRKHAQMLSEAGVDVIFIDLTNGFSYLPVLDVLCGVYRGMWREGNPVPKISFVLNASAAKVFNELQPLYSNTDNERLWYEMNGKPLILAPLSVKDEANTSRFTLRHAWFDTQYNWGGAWWGDGVDKWSWGDFSPQRSVHEEMSVMAASHANFNIGRSYSGNSPAEKGGSQPANTTAGQRAAGTYFKQQFQRAIDCDPDFIFITAWNEWVAQRQVNGDGTSYPWFLGKRIYNGDSFFVDCYNHEYSRDIEPCTDDFRDTYYYYMADYIRRYKGAEAVKPVDKIHKIDIDGKFAEWDLLSTRYRDYTGDTEERDHFGYGYKNISLKNATGRNDFRYAKVATDCKSIFFYAETVDEITPHSDPNWMRLFISVKGGTGPSWEGFQWVVNNSVTSSSKTTIQKSKGGWNWETAAAVEYAVSGNKIEIAIPLSALGITDARNFTVDFKWVDNSVAGGDICECMSDGDSAPGGRFRYRYIFEY